MIINILKTNEYSKIILKDDFNHPKIKRNYPTETEFYYSISHDLSIFECKYPVANVKLQSLDRIEERSFKDLLITSPNSLKNFFSFTNRCFAERYALCTEEEIKDFFLLNPYFKCFYEFSYLTLSSNEYKDYLSTFTNLFIDPSIPLNIKKLIKIVAPILIPELPYFPENVPINEENITNTTI